MYREDATTWLSSRPCATATTRHHAPVIVHRIVATRTLLSTRVLSTLPSTIRLHQIQFTTVPYCRTVLRSLYQWRM